MLQRCIVLDIEGTTTPISFVTDVLFPYARENVGNHLDATYDSAETKEDIKLLRAQVSYCHYITTAKEYIYLCYLYFQTQNHTDFCHLT